MFRLFSLYNLYNLLAAGTACCLLGLDILSSRNSIPGPAMAVKKKCGAVAQGRQRRKKEKRCAIIPDWTIAAVAAGIFVLLVVLQIIARAPHPMRKAAGGMLYGVLALAAVNLSGVFTGVTLPVSLLSLSVSAVAGIPGVTLMLLLRMIVQ